MVCEAGPLMFFCFVILIICIDDYCIIYFDARCLFSIHKLHNIINGLRGRASRTDTHSYEFTSHPWQPINCYGLFSQKRDQLIWLNSNMSFVLRPYEKHDDLIECQEHTFKIKLHCLAKSRTDSAGHSYPIIFHLHLLLCTLQCFWCISHGLQNLCVCVCIL